MDIKLEVRVVTMFYVLHYTKLIKHVHCQMHIYWSPVKVSFIDLKRSIIYSIESKDEW